MASYLRLIGSITIIAYITCILLIWVYANVKGYVYFQGGEPLWFIKYPEWFLGAIGLWTAVDLFVKEVKEIEAKQAQRV